MAYKIDPIDTWEPIIDGWVTSKELNESYKKSQKNFVKWYELEPAEVIRVYLDEEDLPKLSGTEDTNWKKYGWILARMCKNPQQPTVELKPLDTNIKQYPHPGEYVIAVNYFGVNYYTQKLNMHNTVNLNSLPGLSEPANPFTKKDWKIKAFSENFDIREIKSYEGDMTFNGRFGQSIRFGSNITELVGKVKQNFPKGGPLDTLGTKEYSPNVIIKAGQSEPENWSLKTPNLANKPVLEDINKDDSSIWITTNQIVGLTKSVNSTVRGVDPKFFDGKQIILNSNRIVFNSKLNSIHLYSNTDVSIISKRRIILECSEKNRWAGGVGGVQLGLSNQIEGGRAVRTDASVFGPQAEHDPHIQPVLKGHQTMAIIRALIDTINDFSVQLHGAVGGAWVPVPLTQINAASQQLSGALEKLKKRLDKPKSKIVTTV